MSFRSFVRGDSSVDLDAVEEALREDCGIEDVELSTLDGDNWLSVPLVANDEFFVKVLTSQNTLTHSFFTTMRNLGIRVSGNGPFFETYDSPADMAHHEFEAAERMREIGVRAPRPIDVIEADEKAFILFEYLEGFETLSEVDIDDETMREVFGLLRRLHDNGLAHGDFSLENVLVVEGEIYFIDSTNISEEGHDDAVAYDLACALGAFSSRVSPEDVVESALEFFDADDLRHATDFLVVVRLRPGIEDGFSVLEIRRAVEQHDSDA
ncbi:MAG: RIO1 family regulatory kinase/ATPase [Halobacteriales archaeon]|nr:RIO1 family regulatory kinase/ATPase [Halobacteriales archaeon]